MTKQEAISYFGTQAKLGAALGIGQPSVALWDRVPDLQQIRLEKITKGRLKADPSCWGPAKKVS